MAEATAVKTDNVSESEEVRAFYRALTVTQAKMFSYLSLAETDDDIRNRAAEMIKQLETLVIPNEDPRGAKCENGTYNPITKQCE